MDKDKLLKPAENPNHIIRIYNYCNRWCERCSFTAKCLNYKTGEVLFKRLKGNNKYAQEYSKANVLFQKLFFIGTMPFFMIADIFVSLAGKGATVEFTFRKRK